MEHHIGTPEGVIKSYAIERKPLEDRWSKDAVEAIVGTPWRPQPQPGDTSAPRVLPPLPADQQLRSQPKPKEPEIRAPLRPRISKHDLTRWGFTEGCLRCRQMRQGEPDTGAKHFEKCRKRIESEMRREADPRVKRAEDKHTDYEAEKMQAQEAIDARRAAEATRRGGGQDADTPSKTCIIQLIRTSWAHQQRRKLNGSGSPGAHKSGYANAHKREWLFRFCPGTRRRLHD